MMESFYRRLLLLVCLFTIGTGIGTGIAHANTLGEPQVFIKRTLVSFKDLHGREVAQKYVTLKLFHSPSASAGNSAALRVEILPEGYDDRDLAMEFNSSYKAYEPHKFPHIHISDVFKASWTQHPAILLFSSSNAISVNESDIRWEALYPERSTAVWVDITPSERDMKFTRMLEDWALKDNSIQEKFISYCRRKGKEIMEHNFHKTFQHTDIKYYKIPLSGKRTIANDATGFAIDVVRAAESTARAIDIPVSYGKDEPISYTVYVFASVELRELKNNTVTYKGKADIVEEFEIDLEESEPAVDIAPEEEVVKVEKAEPTKHEYIGVQVSKSGDTDKQIWITGLRHGDIILKLGDSYVESVESVLNVGWIEDKGILIYREGRLIYLPSAYGGFVTSYVSELSIYPLSPSLKNQITEFVNSDEDPGSDPNTMVNFRVIVHYDQEVASFLKNEFGALRISYKYPYSFGAGWEDGFYCHSIKHSQAKQIVEKAKQSGLELNSAAVRFPDSREPLLWHSMY